LKKILTGDGEMKKSISKKFAALSLAVLMTILALGGCAADAVETAASESPSATTAAAPATQTAPQPSTEPEVKTPKYIFLLVGDGMSYAQINAAQVYLGNNTSGEIETMNLNFTQFPVAGNVTTYDSTSFCPDSASTATALSCGVKTHSGVIGLAVDKETAPVSITEMLADAGMRIGIVSTVTINHATPAAFYAHIASRNDYYEIALQLAESGFDYFGGGTVSKPTGNDKDREDAYGIIEAAGYAIADTKEEILALNSSSGKVYAVTPVVQDSGAMPYAMDAGAGDLTYADYIQAGINVLDNENGFFMMAESGKIDWACHANDAKATITEVIDFADGVQVAIDFANAHPDETLILITGDHETGGMTIGYAATGYDTAFSILDGQTMSYVAFDAMIADMKQANPGLTLDELLPVIKDCFGLIAPSDPDAAIAANAAMVLTDYEFTKLQEGFAESMLPDDQRSATDETALLYGTYDPLSVTLTHIINNKAGIGWTSYSHTGTPVPVYALGVCSELFSGSYDNTGIFERMVEACGL
jgi:alkaline phosphatase